MAWLITILAGGPVPQFKFEDKSGLATDPLNKLPFYLLVGGPKVSDLEGIPTSAVQTNDAELPDAFRIGHAGVISERFKDLIEGVEPGVHQFFPVTLKRRDGELHSGQYYILHVTQRVACVMYNESDCSPVGHVKTGPNTGMPTYRCSMNNLAISRPAFGGRKLFSTAIVAGGYTLTSQDLGENIVSRGIKNLMILPVNEVDRPWLPEENVREYLEWIKIHHEHVSYVSSL